MQENTSLVASPPWLLDGEQSDAGDGPGLHEWIARELHDLVAQPLTSALVELDGIERGSTHLAPGRAEILQRELRAALQGLRHLMSELRGQVIAPGGLVAQAETLVAEVRARTGLDARLHVAPRWPTDLAPETDRNLCRIIEEALRNVVRHSGASSVEVSLESFHGGLRVSIVDDGVLGPDGPDGVSDGLGTRGMRERAVVIGGVLTVDHARSGSTVAVVVSDSGTDGVER